MKHEQRMISRLVLAALLALVVTPWAAADSPTPTPTRTPRPSGGTSLSDAAKEKELKGGEKGKSIVITNENLSDYAEKGSVTSASGSQSDASKRRPIRSGSNVQVVPTPDAQHTDERRRYWQGQYKRQVELISSLRYQIDVLDREIPGLWRDFYSRDDPMYRDGVIKPKLDKALESRQRTEQQLADAEAELNTIKENARRDGAEPGWFRAIKLPTPRSATPTPGIEAHDAESTG
jgi:hypothetical protein